MGLCFTFLTQRQMVLLHVRFIAANISKKQYLQEQVCSLLSSELFMHCNWWIRSDLQNLVRSTFLGRKGSVPEARARNCAMKVLVSSMSWSGEVELEDLHQKVMLISS